MRDVSSLFNRPRYDARASQSLTLTRALENRVVMSYSGDVDFDLFGFGVLALGQVHREQAVLKLSLYLISVGILR